MAGTGPALAIDAPPLTPPANGLLNSAPVIDSTDDRWINGVTFAPENCDPATVFDPCSSASMAPSVFADASTSSGSPTLTSATAKFTGVDVTRSITGAGIPAGTTILSVTDSTTVVLSANATATASNVTITIVNRQMAPNRRAPLTLQPFGVSTYDTCSAFGFQKADYEGRALRALAARETQAVEHEFWTGAIISANRHLADSTAGATKNITPTTAAGLRSGLALLVQSIADNNLGAGMVHARPSLVTQWSALNMLVWRNNKLYTYSGVLVVPGSGYPGTAPDGTAPSGSVEWAYATEIPQITRGPVEVFADESNPAAILAKHNNQIATFAQRMYSVEFNACAVTAIKIDATADVGGFGS